MKKKGIHNSWEIILGRSARMWVDNKNNLVRLLKGPVVSRTSYTSRLFHTSLKSKIKSHTSTTQHPLTHQRSNIISAFFFVIPKSFSYEHQPDKISLIELQSLALQTPQLAVNIFPTSSTRVSMNSYIRATLWLFEPSILAHPRTVWRAREPIGPGDFIRLLIVVVAHRACA